VLSQEGQVIHTSPFTRQNAFQVSRPMVSVTMLHLSTLALVFPVVATAAWPGDATGGAQVPAPEDRVATAVGAASEPLEVGGVPAGLTYEPRSIKAGAVFVTPALRLDVGYDNNVGLVASNRTASRYTSVNLSSKAQVPIRDQRFELELTANSQRYAATPEADALDAELALRGVNPVSVRAGAAWRVSYQQAHDSAGSTDRQRITLAPDRWHAVNAGAVFRYGAEGAMGRLEGELNYFSKRYTTNEVLTGRSSLDVSTAVGRFFYRMGPKSLLLSELRAARNDYVEDSYNLDSIDSRLYLGAVWEASAALSGSLRLGYESKKFDTVRPSFQGATWEMATRWLPLTYSQFDLKLTRGAADSNGDATNYTVNTTETLLWVHAWRPYFKSTIGLSLGRVAYSGNGRVDSVNGGSLGLRYDLSRWMQFGFTFERARRSSTNNLYDYQRDLSSLSAQFAL
jgi:hypothetical protein